MPGWLAGMDVTQARLFTHVARYERQSATQAVATGTNVQVQFPTAVLTDASVVASGGSNTAFTLDGGIWLVDWGLRVATADPSWSSYLAAGSTTFANANVIAAGGIKGLTGGGSGIVPVPQGSTTAVCLALFQSSAGSINLGSFGHLTHIAFSRINPA